MKKQKIAAENLRSAEIKMQEWYDNEFMPYKQQKEQEKQDFSNLAKIVVNNTAEIKYMLANIYDNDSTKVVQTWNTLGLEPAILDIKLKENTLIITDKNSKESFIEFNTLLDNIEKALGE